MFKVGMKLRIGAVVLEDLKEAMEKSGVDRVFVAKDGSEAMRIVEEVVRSGEVDLLLLDDVLASQMDRRRLTELKYRTPLPAIVELETRRLPNPLSS